MLRYQQLYDSAIVSDLGKIDADLRAQSLHPELYTTLNMLNAKYIVLSPEARGVIPNRSAYGNAWFVRDVKNVNSPTEELKAITEVDPRHTAVIDQSKFKATVTAYDSAATITVKEMTPPKITYESSSSTAGLAVFSEIYYPKGWSATIDGKDAPILRADYVLRALEIPAGKHTIEFVFRPKPYVIGNKITTASSWLVVLIVLGTIGFSLRKDPEARD